MPNPTGLNIRKMSTLTSKQGISVINELMDTIRTTPNLKKHEFGVGVMESLLSMRARLADGAFFSKGMEKALTNWGNGIGKWVETPKGGLDS